MARTGHRPEPERCGQVGGWEARGRVPQQPTLPDLVSSPVGPGVRALSCRGFRLSLTPRGRPALSRGCVRVAPASIPGVGGPAGRTPPRSFLLTHVPRAPCRRPQELRLRWTALPALALLVPPAPLPRRHLRSWAGDPLVIRDINKLCLLWSQLFVSSD